MHQTAGLKRKPCASDLSRCSVGTGKTPLPTPKSGEPPSANPGRDVPPVPGFSLANLACHCNGSRLSASFGTSETVPYLTPDIDPTVGANHDHGRRSQA